MMGPQVMCEIYDHLLPGWRAGPLRSGERLLRCPLHDDARPSLRLNEDKLTWYCFPCGTGGGAYDLAVAMLGKQGAHHALKEINFSLRAIAPGQGSSRSKGTRVARKTSTPSPGVIDLGFVPEEWASALRLDHRIASYGVLLVANARWVRARLWDKENSRWRDWREFIGFPGASGESWRLWVLDPDLRVRKKLSVGQVDLLLSPTLAEPDGEPIERLWDVEGESDWLVGLEAGLVHVLTSTGGAASLKGHERHRERLSQLLVQEVCVVRDLDDTGRRGAQKAAEWWLKLGMAVRVVQLPQALGEKGDLRDYVLLQPEEKGDVGDRTDG